MNKQRTLAKLSAFKADHVAVVLAGSFGALGLVRDLVHSAKPVIVISRSRFLIQTHHAIGIPVLDDKEKLDILGELPHLITGKLLLFTDNDSDLALIYTNWNMIQANYLTSMSLQNQQLSDKSQLYAAALEANIPVPQTYCDTDQWTVNTFPVIVKPLHKEKLWELSGTREKKAYECNSKQELRETLQMMQYYQVASITQEKIQGTADSLYGVTLYRHQNGQVSIAFAVRKLRQYPISNGSGTVHITCDRPILIEQSKRLLEKVNYRGVAYIEYKYCPETNRFYIIEVNGRFPEEYGIVGKLPASFACVCFDDIAGLSDSGYTYLPPKRPVVWIQLANDIRAIFQGQKQQLFSYLRYSFEYKIQDSVFMWSDLSPFWHYCLQLVRKACSYKPKSTISEDCKKNYVNL